jgi:hypothetical protein
MKQKKLRLSDLQGKLSREEMKRIMAGSDGSANDCNCNSADECSAPTPVCGNACNGPKNGKWGKCVSQ